MTQTIPSCSRDTLPLITFKTSLADSDKAPQKKPFQVLTEITAHNVAQVFAVIEAGCALGYKFWAVCDNAETRNHFQDLEELFPEQISWEKSMDAKLFKKVDIYFSPELPCKEKQELLIEHGVIPMVPSSGMFIDFDPESESGNAFTFEEGSKWHMIEALIRSRETQKFSYDWRNLRQNVKKTQL